MANHHQPYSHTADVCVCVVQHDEVKKQKLRVEETNSKNEEIVQIEWIRINRERDGTSSNVRHALFSICFAAAMHFCIRVSVRARVERQQLASAEEEKNDLVVGRHRCRHRHH